VLGGLHHILDGDETAQFPVVIDHQYALKAVLVHELPRFVQASAFLDRNHAVGRRHDLRHWLIQIAFEAQITVGDNTHHALVFHDWQPGELMLARQPHHITHAHARRNGNRILEHAGFIALDLDHLGRLLLDRKILVNNADAAFLSQRDGQTSLGHGIHGSGHQRNIEADVTGQLRGQIHLVRQHRGMGGQQEDIIVGEGFFGDADRHGVSFPDRVSMRPTAPPPARELID
jgi:hypothetical protein